MNFKPFKYGTLAVLPLMVVLLMSFLLPPDHITLYMAGDSTMSIKEVKAYPETGWGLPFKAFFDQTVRPTFNKYMPDFNKYAKGLVKVFAGHKGQKFNPYNDIRYYCKYKSYTMCSLIHFFLLYSL